MSGDILAQDRPIAVAQPRGAEDCLDVQFFQNEPEIALNEPKIAANEPEFMVDSVEPLVHRPELGVNRHKLGVDSRESRVAGIEPLVLSGESCVHLGKPAVNQLRMLAKMLFQGFTAHRSFEKCYAFVE